MHKLKTKSCSSSQDYCMITKESEALSGVKVGYRFQVKQAFYFHLKQLIKTHELTLEPIDRHHISGTI